MIPMFIGLAGPSGCGKSTLVHALLQNLGADRCVVVPTDAYYHDLSHLTSGERSLRNFDHPAALDSALLVQHLRNLRAGLPVALPSYDFATHTRRATSEWIEPRPLVLIEGIFSLALPGLTNILDLRIYLDLDADTCLIRRLARDTLERGRDAKEISDRFHRHVRPAIRSHVAPQRAFADLVLDARQPITDSIASCLSCIAKIQQP